MPLYPCGGGEGREWDHTGGQNERNLQNQLTKWRGGEGGKEGERGKEGGIEGHREKALFASSATCWLPILNIEYLVIYSA